MLIVVVGVGIGGCGGGVAGDSVDCTAKGCSSGATVLLPRLDVPNDETLTVRVCADGRCQDGKLQPALDPDLQAEVPVPLEGNSVELNVSVRDERGKVVASGRGTAIVHVTYPNGRDCPPVCRRVQVRLAGGRLVSA